MKSEVAGPQTRDPLPVRLIEHLLATGAVLSGVVCLVTGLQITADVISRNLNNRPIPGTLEMVELLWMPIMGFLAMGYAQARNEQIRVTLLLENASPAARKVLDFVAEVVTIALVCWMASLAIDSAILATEAGESAPLEPWIPVWVARIMVAAGLVLLIAGALVRVYRIARGDSGTPDNFYVEAEQP